eukprot:355141-Chlamydomonas_euryale.AAC.2
MARCRAVRPHPVCRPLRTLGCGDRLRAAAGGVPCNGKAGRLSAQACPIVRSAGWPLVQLSLSGGVRGRRAACQPRPAWFHNEGCILALAASTAECTGDAVRGSRPQEAYSAQNSSSVLKLSTQAQNSGSVLKLSTQKAQEAQVADRQACAHACVCVYVCVRVFGCSSVCACACVRVFECGV